MSKQNTLKQCKTINWYLIAQKGVKMEKGFFPGNYSFWNVKGHIGLRKYEWPALFKKLKMSNLPKQPMLNIQILIMWIMSNSLI